MKPQRSLQIEVLIREPGDQVPVLAERSPLAGGSVDDTVKHELGPPMRIQGRLVRDLIPWGEREGAADGFAPPSV